MRLVLLSWPLGGQDTMVRLTKPRSEYGNAAPREPGSVIRTSSANMAGVPTGAPRLAGAQERHPSACKEQPLPWGALRRFGSARRRGCCRSRKDGSREGKEAGLPRSAGPDGSRGWEVDLAQQEQLAGAAVDKRMALEAQVQLQAR